MNEPCWEKTNMVSASGNHSWRENAIRQLRGPMLSPMQWQWQWQRNLILPQLFIASVQSCPVGFFCIVQELLQSGTLEVKGEHSVVHCDLFANYLSGKINCICSKLDARLIIQSLDVQEYPSYFMGLLQIMQPEDVDRIVGGLRPTACQLNPCPPWLIKAAWAGLRDWLLLHQLFFNI